MHNLFRFIDRELEEMDEKAGRDGKLTRAEVEDGKNLAKFKMALLTCDEMEQARESRDGSSGRRYRDGASGESGYHDGASGRRGDFYTQRDDAAASGRRLRDGTGRYADGSNDGYFGDGYSNEDMSGRRGYSRAEAKDKLISQMESMMDTVSPQAQRAIERAISKLEEE